MHFEQNKILLFFKCFQWLWGFFLLKINNDTHNGIFNTPVRNLMRCFSFTINLEDVGVDWLLKYHQLDIHTKYQCSLFLAQEKNFIG